MKVWTVDDKDMGLCTSHDVGLPKTDLELWTWADVEAGIVPGHLKGTPKPPSKYEVQSTSPNVPPTSSETLVQTYLDVFNEIGGKKALIVFAKNNPMKFYDQLLKLLVAMEAPAQAMAIQMNFGPMSDAELETLSTNDLKRRLLRQDIEDL